MNFKSESRSVNSQQNENGQNLQLKTDSTNTLNSLTMSKEYEGRSDRASNKKIDHNAQGTLPQDPLLGSTPLFVYSSLQRTDNKRGSQMPPV